MSEKLIETVVTKNDLKFALNPVMLVLFILQ
ncbi:hypothetical protein LAC30SC_06015 [Lactobacillus amylovorus]|uniref:Uncharacterized protein n=1 Tax=Lactobacillus amylovorus TaxID=1604 RepID=F0TF43_LACAM|nr:hypothetical protein LAC30SC_06015 [Lactobacillus amylovorus]